jgi:hypothetical protein
MRRERCCDPIHLLSGLFKGSEVRALVVRSTSGLSMWACLSASCHDVHDFSNGRTCLGHNIVLFDLCGRRIC